MKLSHYTGKTCHIPQVTLFHHTGKTCHITKVKLSHRTGKTCHIPQVTLSRHTGKMSHLRPQDVDEACQDVVHALCIAQFVVVAGKRGQNLTQLRQARVGMAPDSNNTLVSHPHFTVSATFHSHTHISLSQLHFTVTHTHFTVTATFQCTPLKLSS